MVSVIPKHLGRTVWPLTVIALVSLAIYVSGGRLLLGALPRVQQDIEQLLSPVSYTHLRAHETV